MKKYKAITDNISIEVTPAFLQAESSPEMQQFLFKYQILIHNGTQEILQLVSRYWLITNGVGVEREVRGEGVVGQKPILNPGDVYYYESFCPLNTKSGKMVGRFLFVTDSGAQIEAKVPEFYLRDDSLLH